jgi:DNA polymerase III epsilon subunit-like protein
MGIEFFAVDTETTGVTDQHEVIEVSVIRCSDKVQITRFIFAEHPERASLDALRVTGKTLNDLKVGISKEEAVQDLEKFFESDGLTPAHRCMVAHNEAFDRRFLHALWAKCGKTFPANMFLDTMQMARAAAKNMGLVKPKVNLEAACDLFKIKKTATFHNAKMDTRNTYFLWKKLSEEVGVDYLPMIKTAPHLLKAGAMSNVDELDLSDVI